MSFRHILTGCFVLGILSWIMPDPGSRLHAQLPVANFKSLKRDVDLFSSGFGMMMEDNRGFIWFGSRNGGGLYRYDGYNLVTFMADPARMKESLGTSLIQDVYQVNDTLIYVATFFGYSVLNPITGSIRTYNNSSTAFDNIRTTNTYTFLQDSIHHVLWIGTQNGLAGMDHITGHFELKRPLRKDSLIANVITQIQQDPHNTDKLYLAGPDGFFEYDKVLNHYSEIICPLPGFEKLDVRLLYRDPDNIFWLSLNERILLQYNPETGAWKSFTIPPASMTPLQNNNVSDILYAGKNKLWLTTFSQVGILHTDTGLFEGWQYQPDNPNGLSKTYYSDLISDRHGRLWFGSREAIQMAVQPFLPASNAVTDLRVAITNVDINPVITDSQKPLLFTETMSLDVQQRDITFQYVLPNPLDPAAVTYEYQLEGYDKNWITSDQRSVRYAKLKGGEYVFRIKAKEGKNGTWTPMTELPVVIPKKTTEHFFFWIIVALGTIVIAASLFYFLITRARQQEKMKADFEHRLSEVQMQALRAQMNPHFLFNSLNSIKYYAISKSKDETAAYLSKFALLVRNILTNSKSKTISLKEELDALRLYIEIEHLRLEGKFDYTIDIDSSIQVRQVQIPPMILQPFVENAIWHGLMHKNGRGHLRVQVHDMGRQIQCLIEDNGIGRSRSAELKKAQVEHRKSEGMQITADRIELVNRLYNIDTKVDVIDLFVADGSPAGTRVVINIPFIRDEEE